MDPDDDTRRFAANLYDLYRAGRVLLPEIAATYGNMTTEVHNTTGYVSSLFEGVDQGNTLQDYQSGVWLPPVEPAHRKLMALREDLQGVFRESSMILHDTGEALVTIADSYRTDDEIEALLLEHVANEDTPGVREQYDEPPLDRPEPPGIGDPHPDVPSPPPPGSPPADRYPSPGVST